MTPATQLIAVAPVRERLYVVANFKETQRGGGVLLPSPGLDDLSFQDVANQRKQRGQQPGVRCHQRLATAARATKPSGFRSNVLRQLPQARPMVLAAIPVIRETVAMPPYPALLASVAANSRRPRSSRCGDNDAKRSLMGSESLIHTRYAINPQLRIGGQPDSLIG